jgi:hypothetical protein
MSENWGKGSRNNTVGYGQGASNSTNNWGKSHSLSNAGQTDIVGLTSVRITYPSSALCADASDPTPTVQNNAGSGTFSSTTGLVINSTTGVVDVSGSTAGATYTITYTDTDAETATFDLTINTLPSVTVSVSAGAICVGESTTITASGASTYSWSNGQTGSSITVSPTTTTLFTATGTDSNGCTSSGSTTITVNALPTVEITGTLTYCAGGSTTLTATAGLSSYLWSTGATTQAITVSTTGSYTVTGTDSNGCSATSSASTVTELPLDSATVTYSSSAYCQMPTGALAVDGYYPLYTSQADANAASSDGNSHAHSLTGGTYYMPNDGVIIYHGTYSLTTPAPTITGESGTFSESTGNLSIDSSTGVINVNNSTAGTYTVVYTTNGSCPNTINNTITINALDGATFGYSASSLAQTGTASLTTTPTTSGGTYSAYPSGLSINSSTGEIDLAASTIQSYKIFYETSGAGCPNSSTFDLAVTASDLSNNHSFSFDGANDYIDAGNDSSLEITGNFTISAWVKLNGYTNTYPRLVGKGNSADNRCNYGIGFYGTTPAVIGNSSGTWIANYNSTALSTGVWYNIVGVYDGTNFLLYNNGSLDTTNSASGFNAATAASATSGDSLLISAKANGASGFVNGLIDEVGIWNTALTSTQIQSIYDATSTNLTKDLTTVSGSNLVYWNRMGD